MPVRTRTHNGRWLLDFRVGGRRIRETLGAEYAQLGKLQIQAMERAKRAEVEAEGAGSADSTWRSPSRARPGWRRSSVLGLRWEHVDWDRELIHGRGKGRAGGRALVAPLTAELRSILMEAAGPDGLPAEGPVVARQGRQVGDIDQAFDKARRAAGYPDVLFKSLRHSVAQEILATTGSMALAGATLAHRQLRTTQRHYARVQVEQVRA
jgi:integrase